MGIDDARYAKIQGWELGWWKGARFNPQVEWGYYDKVFSPWLVEPFDLVADVGCGPVPYLFNGTVNYRRGFAVDPLINEYRRLEKFSEWWEPVRSASVEWHESTESLFAGELCAVFCFNTLDHAQDPGYLLEELARITGLGGLLFLFVDVGKKPDQMHPHTIELSWICKWLAAEFDEELLKVEKSWKFANDVLYYVGRRVHG